MTRKGNAKPVGSGNKQAVRNAQGQFIKGVSGNAQGRPSGSRSQATLIAVPHPVSWTQVCHAAGLTDIAAFHCSLA